MESRSDARAATTATGGTPRLLVTGGTGTIGHALVRELSRRGIAARALARDPARGEPLPGIRWVSADLASRDTLPPVLESIDTVFLLTGNGDGAVGLQKTMLRAAREAGVARVVKLSALGASDHSRSLIGTWHWAVEKALESSGMAWTILRPHHFMQNLLLQREAILAEGVVRYPTGEARIPFVDTRDVAEAAAVVLTEPGHAGATYTLTGPEAISYRQATAILGSAASLDLRFVEETADEHRRRRLAAGDPEWLVAAQWEIAAYQRTEGPTASVSPHLGKLLRRAPRGFDAFAREIAAVALGPSGD